MKTFWQFENRRLITAILRMKTVLSSGSRASLLLANSDLLVIKTPEGARLSLALCSRAWCERIVERVLHTMDEIKKQYQGQRLWSRDPLDEDRRCVTDAQKKALFEQAGEDDARFTELIWQRSLAAAKECQKLDRRRRQ